MPPSSALEKAGFTKEGIRRDEADTATAADAADALTPADPTYAATPPNAARPADALPNL